MLGDISANRQNCMTILAQFGDNWKVNTFVSKKIHAG